MLVLTRKIGEKIVIGNGEITIKIVSCKNGAVQLGIDAPDDVSVHREEVYNRIRREEEYRGDGQPRDINPIN